MFCFGCDGGSNRTANRKAGTIFCYGNGDKSNRRHKNKRNYSSTSSLTDSLKPSRSHSQPSSAYGSMASRLDDAGHVGVEQTRITSRILALTYPSGGSDSAYRQSIKEISEGLRRNHADRYKIFNVSQKRSDLGRANSGAVVELGWPDQLAPALDKLCSICKQMESWLLAHPENLVVIHCKGGRSRAAIVVASYMHYATVCSSEETVADRFAMQLFSEKFIAIDGQPSHKRYVRYFANLISGVTKVNPTPIHLQSISFYQFPIGKTIVVKVYERMKPVYNSEKLFINDQHASLSINDDGLSLRGDLIIKCFEKSTQQSNGNNDDRQLLFQCQFNTCALELQPQQPHLLFYKTEMDLPDDCIDGQACVEFNFIPNEARSRSSSLKRHHSRETQSQPRAQSVGAETHRLSGNFARADSYENFDRPEDDRSLSLSAANDPPIKQTTNSLLNADVAIQQLASVDNIAKDSKRDSLPLSHTSQSSTQKSGSVDVPSPETTKQVNSGQTDGADSGIGSDSPKQSALGGKVFVDSTQLQEKTTKMPPVVPPKPRGRPQAKEYTDEDPEESVESTIGGDDEDEEGGNGMQDSYDESTVGRERSVLPAGLRAAPTKQSEENPRASNSTLPRGEPTPIEPDLVAKGRYDPSSKCFSYVPAKSLKEHYKAPKKPPPRRPSIERSNLDISPREEEELKKEISFIGSNLHKRAETPKWDEEITKLAGDLPTESDYKRKAAEEWRRSRRDDYMPYSEDDYFERPVVVEHSRQANRQQRSPPRRRFGSFSANDSSGDMDELCDPDYYMSFSNNNGTSNPERRSKSVIPYGSRHGGNADPRQPFRTVSQRDLDDLNDLIDYNSKLPPSGRSYTPKPAHSQSFDRDAYRTRNSRSVNALPTKGSAQYFAHENYDPLKDSEDPDDWLRSKLHTLRQRRRNDPAVARRQVERDLLEELKNTSTNVPSRPVQPKQQQFNQNPPQQQFNQNPPQQQGHQSRAPRSTQPAQQVQQHNPMRQAAVHQAPNYSDEPRGPNQPWQYSPNIDRLRQANRENMDHTFRSKTPNYYSNTGTFDRAAAVRQRSATPNILLPTNQQQSRLPLQIARETPTLPSHSSDPFDFVPQKPRPYSAVPLTTPPKRDFAAPPTPKSERSPRDSYPPRIDPTSTPQKFKAKPPTPPPASRRDRSASPATSPLFGKKPQIVIDSERRYQEKLEKEARERNGNGHSSPTPREEPPRRPTASSNYGQIYQRVLPPVTGASTSRPQDLSSQKRAANSRLNDEYSDDEQGHDFGYLKNIVQNGRRDVPTPSSQYTSTTKSILKRPGSQDYGYSVGTGSTSGYNYYGPTGHTDTIDSLSSSRLSNPEIYAAPTPPSQRRFGGRQVEDSDYAATNRSDTPQFPVGSIQSRGDTPLPYHPLLYQGASQQAPPEQQQNGYAPINSRFGFRH